ncbi:MAG: ABC transporter ATP-binding protein [Roseibium sp.]|nr:ABC transporter ATP-binding protein [Roseibium sp.]
MSLLEVENLRTHFISRDIDNQIRVAKALNDVSFRLEAGKVLGFVGETGAGKSLTAQSICGLLRPPARIVGGSVLFDGQDLIEMPQEELNALRGDQIAMVVQNPRTSLDPLTRIGDQLVRIHQAHTGGPVTASRGRALDMMQAVGIPDPANRSNAWPHELSGGMAQRVLIAMALMNNPKLLIADEPTTGLDVTVQAQILDLMKGLTERFGMAMIIITHDLGIVAHYSDEIAVMFAGTIVESGPVREVFAKPDHPYTRSLIASTPEKLQIGGGAKLGGQPPDLYNLPSGCPLRTRCTFAEDVCATPPTRKQIGGGHYSVCHFSGALPEGGGPQ